MTVVIDGEPKGKPSRLIWYRRDPEAMLAEISDFENLKDYGAITVLRDLLFIRGGAIPDDARIARKFLGCNAKGWETLRGKLLDLGKLYLADGVLRSPEIDREIEEGSGKVAPKFALSSGKVSPKFALSSGKVSPNLAANPLESLGPDSHRQTDRQTEQSKKESYGCGLKAKESGEQETEAPPNPAIAKKLAEHSMSLRSMPPGRLGRVS
jgi:hypothetical protein